MTGCPWSMCRLWDTFQFEGTYEWLSVGRQTEPYVEPIASTRDARKAGIIFSLLQSLPFAIAQSSVPRTVCPFLSIPAAFSLSKAIAVLIPLIPPLHSWVYFGPVYILFSHCGLQKRLPLFRFWMPSSFGRPHPILAPLLLAQCWPPVSSKDYKIEERGIIK